MSHPSSLQWFRLAANDLRPHEWVVLRWHAWRCGACATRWTEARRDAASEEALPPLPGVSAGGPGRRRRGVAPWAAALASSALVLWVVASRAPDDDLRSKGGSRFQLWLPGPTPQLLGERCAPGETVQAVVETKRRYLAVVSIDPAGRAELLFPLGGERSAPAPQGKATLPQSWTFDAVAGTERFVALLSDVALDRVEAVRLAKGETAPRDVERIEHACTKSPGGGAR